MTLSGGRLCEGRCMTLSGGRLCEGRCMTLSGGRLCEGRCMTLSGGRLCEGRCMTLSDRRGEVGQGAKSATSRLLSISLSLPWCARVSVHAYTCVFVRMRVRASA